jgi:uncharacterized membrane protein YccC
MGDKLDIGARRRMRLPVARPRRYLTSSTMAAAARKIARWWDWLDSTDPDRARARMAARATVTAAAATAAVWGLSQLRGAPMRAGLPAVMLTLVTMVSLSEGTVRGQKATFSLAPLVGGAGLALGTAIGGHPWVGRAGFLAVIFLAVLVRRYGPRGMTLGMVGYLGFFIALFFRLALGALPFTLACLAAAMALGYLVRFALLPDREPRLLERALGAFRRAVALALDTFGDVVSAPRWTERGRRRGRRALDRVNRVALVVEEHLGVAGAGPVPAPGDAAGARARAAIVDMEMQLGRLASVLRGLIQQGAASELHHPLARALRRSARRVRRGESPGDDGRVPRGLPAVRETLDRLERGAAALARVDARAASRDPDRPPLAPPPPPPRPGRFPPVTRLAIQATVASGVAMLLGQLLAADRWYWAVIGAYVMFIRAETVGEIVRRGWHRVAGTAAGVLAGLHLARVVAGHRALELAMMFGCIFLAYYLIRVSYGLMVLAITVVLADLYGLLGSLSAGILYLRLTETLVGCAVGAAVGALLLPTRGGPKLRAALSGLLAALADLLESAASGQAGDSDGENEEHGQHDHDGRALLARLRLVDQRLRSLEETARPMTGAVVRVAAPAAARQLHFAWAAAHFGRQLAAATAAAGEDPELRRILRTASAPVARRARALASAAAGEGPTGGCDDEGGDAPVPPHDGSSAALPLYWLARLGDALRALCHSLG